jgi:hypothetical protein
MVDITNEPVRCCEYRHRRDLDDTRDGSRSSPTAGFERLHLGRESRLAIEAWAEHWTDHTKPFVWEKAADGIITR